MTAVSVLVPYRSDLGGPRDRALEFVREWWAREHPGYRVIIGRDLGDAQWCKAGAVAAALTWTGAADTLIIADADVICYGVGLAVEVVQAQGVLWAIPHHRVNRLTEAATEAVMAGGTLPGTPPFQRHAPNEAPRGRSSEVAESYTGVVGGGLVVLSRALYERVPLDPRFAGWGLEDASWGRALAMLAGHPWRGPDPLWHLWHPPAERLTRAVGNRDSLALHQRYLGAYTPEGMGALLAEFRSPVSAD